MTGESGAGEGSYEPGLPTPVPEVAQTAQGEEGRRLALVFTVVGLGLLGASGTLLADEVRIVRRAAVEAAVRPSWVEATAGLVTGLTAARLLLVVSAFVLFLAAYLARG